MSTFLEIKKIFEAKVEEATVILANAAVNYFQDRITEQQDVNGNSFKQRTYELANRKGRPILLQTGILRRSIQIKDLKAGSFEIVADTTQVGSGLDYAEIHNEGGEIVVTEKMKAFFWAKYYELSSKQKTNSRGERRATKQNESLNKDAEFYKNMALKKIGDTINIPKREFIGESEELKSLLKKELQNFLDVQDF